jgi:hypothetical protein
MPQAAFNHLAVADAFDVFAASIDQYIDNAKSLLQNYISIVPFRVALHAKAGFSADEAADFMAMATQARAFVDNAALRPAAAQMLALLADMIR